MRPSLFNFYFLIYLELEIWFLEFNFLSLRLEKRLYTIRHFHFMF
jgi:hypothetical protein